MRSTTARQVAALTPDATPAEDHEREKRKLRMENRRLRNRLRDEGVDPDAD